MASAESVAGVPETISVAETALPESRGAMDRRLLDELWCASDAPGWGLERDEFDRIMAEAGISQNFGLDPGVAATPRQQAEFFRGLRLSDLVLARACAAGNEPAWEHFIAQHRQPLIRAAISITGSETLGRDLADQLYAELFGLNTARWRTALPPAFVSRTRLADRLAAHHAGSASRGSSSPQPARAAARRDRSAGGRCAAADARRRAFAVGARHRTGAAGAGCGRTLPVGGILS